MIDFNCIIYSSNQGWGSGAARPLPS